MQPLAVALAPEVELAVAPVEPGDGLAKAAQDQAPGQTGALQVQVRQGQASRLLEEPGHQDHLADHRRPGPEAEDSGAQLQAQGHHAQRQEPGQGFLETGQVQVGAQAHGRQSREPGLRQPARPPALACSEAMACAVLLLLASLQLPAGHVRGPEPGTAELLAALAGQGIPAEERHRALELLSVREEALPLEPLARLARRLSREELPVWIRCLERTGPEALPLLRRHLRSRDPLVRAEAVYATVVLDDARGAALARQVLADHRQPEAARVAALRGLAVRDPLFAHAEALRRLAIAEGALLHEALAVLRRHGDLGDAPYLVDLLEERHGRAANEAVQLLQRLTGYHVANDPREWRYWLLRHRLDGTPFRREPRPGEEPPRTLSYMGVPILGERVVFVLDSSSSMNERLPERSPTRGEQAVHELRLLLPRLPARAAFDVVFFSGLVHSFGEDSLVPRDEEHLARLDRWLEGHDFRGATNLDQGLEEALAREGVEEIVLLTDGEPTAGVTEPGRILARVDGWNRWRNVRINAIALGAPVRARRLLARLVQRNDGTLRVLQ